MDGLGMPFSPDRPDERAVYSGGTARAQGNWRLMGPAGMF